MTIVAFTGFRSALNEKNTKPCDNVKPKAMNINGHSYNIYDVSSYDLMLTADRPKTQEISNEFCVPVAFTSKQQTIEGKFIGSGIDNGSKPNKRTGYAVLNKNKVKFYLTDSINEPALTKEAIASKGSLFQQDLLVYRNRIIPTNLFGTARIQCRALAEMNNGFSIIESATPITISEFQDALIALKVTNAIYNDMGSWSEGWYRAKDNSIVKIGNNHKSTDKQTNWLVAKCRQ